MTRNSAERGFISGGAQRRNPFELVEIAVAMPHFKAIANCAGCEQTLDRRADDNSSTARGPVEFRLSFTG
jgi:hypothetical protein